MSQELHALLKKRAQMRVLRWPAGLAVSFGLHSAVVAGVFLWPHSVPEAPQEKIRWITLPAASGGVSGGSAPTVEGETRGRQRRVEELAPVKTTPTPVQQEVKPPTPKMTDASPVTPKPPAKTPTATNPDTTSRGTAKATAKGENPVKNVVPGAAGSGDSGGVGRGTTGIPGLRTSKGMMGGTGILQEFLGISDFPLWYAQQIQDNVTRNWVQLRTGEGRVQIYFRIMQSGKIESARVEISSGKPELDDMALQAVRRTTLPRLPEEFEGDSIGVRFWFQYGS